MERVESIVERYEIEIRDDEPILAESDQHTLEVHIFTQEDLREADEEVLRPIYEEILVHEKRYSRAFHGSGGIKKVIPGMTYHDPHRDQDSIISRVSTDVAGYNVTEDTVEYKDRVVIEATGQWDLYGPMPPVYTIGTDEADRLEEPKGPVPVHVSPWDLDSGE